MKGKKRYIIQAICLSIAFWLLQVVGNIVASDGGEVQFPGYLSIYLLFGPVQVFLECQFRKKMLKSNLLDS